MRSDVYAKLSFFVKSKSSKLIEITLSFLSLQYKST